MSKKISKPKMSVKNLNIKLKEIENLFHQLFAERQYKQAMQLAIEAHKLAPALVAPLSDAATCAIYLEEWDSAITYARKALQRDPNHINSLDAMSHAYSAYGNWQEAGKFGRQALELRHQNVMARYSTLPTPPEQVSQMGKNIIAFSLFGSLSAYVEPAVINTQIVQTIYPNWICRFYVDESVNEDVIQRLKENNAEIILVSEEDKKLPGTMWRFLAMDDPNVHYILFRDADSVISQREAKAVQEWVESGKRFHTMRDSGSHTELMLAGLWGAIAGSVPNMREKMEQYVAQGINNTRFADQFFLRDIIWAYAVQSLYAHDRLFGFMDAHPFDDRFFNYDITHIGCDEGTSLFTSNVNLPEGTPIVWQLWTKILPQLNEDLSVIEQNVRLVCQYPTVVTNGVIKGYIPRRYSRGIETGSSFISVIDPSKST